MKHEIGLEQQKTCMEITGPRHVPAEPGRRARRHLTRGVKTSVSENSIQKPAEIGLVWEITSSLTLRKRLK